MFSVDIFTKTLFDLGLTELETKLYLIILKHSNYNWSSISAEMGISRVHLYQILNKLEKHGFIFKTDKNYSNLTALSPEKVANLLRQKTLELSRQSVDLEAIMPDLLTGFYLNSKNPITRFYEGKVQFRMLFDSLLDSGEPILHFGSNELFADLVGYDYFKNYISKRVSKKISTREITYSFPYYQARMELDEKEFRQVKLISKEKEKPGSYVVVGNSVSLWNPVLPRIIKIEDHILAEFFRSNFDLLWDLI